ncbi:MAG: FtsX-like permease family protein [Lysinibacillus sp.]
MRFKDQLDFVFSHLRKNKLRVSMTVIAAMMGCAFLIVLASVGFGLEKTITDDILSDENVTNIELMSGEQLSEKDVEKIEALDHVRNVRSITRVMADANVSFEDRTSFSPITLTNFEKYAQVNDELSEGRFPTAKNEIVVGYHFAQFLQNDADRKAINEKSIEAEAEGTWYDGSEEGYKKSVVGMEIDVTVEPHTTTEKESDKTSWKIVGVLPPPSYEWATDNQIIMSDENRSLIEELYMSTLSEESAQQIMPSEVFQDEMMIFADQLENVEGILQTLRDDGYQVYSVTEQLDEVNMVFAVIKVGLVLVGAIAVIIASIGIFNTMTMAVTERTREIGVMKALGASPKLIKRLFLMESAFIGVIGVALAIIISYAISFLVNILMPFAVTIAFGEEGDGLQEMVLSYIPIELTIVAAVISLGVAILSGVRPAKKATKIEVMQALRQEL